MKNKLLKLFAFTIMMVTMLSTMIFANETEVSDEMTSQEFLKLENENGEIVLEKDITLSDALILNNNNYKINLNNHTLKLSKNKNNYINKANVILQNGTLDIDGVNVDGNAIFQLQSNSNLTLNKVNLKGNEYGSSYAIFYLTGNGSKLNINNSNIKLENDVAESGGVIKSEVGLNASININNSDLDFKNVGRGLIEGNIEIKNSTLKMTGNNMDNGINGTAGKYRLNVDNSKITISNTRARALTVADTDINITNNSVLNFWGNGEKDIKFRTTTGKINVDKSSILNFRTVDLPKDASLSDLIVSETYKYISDDKGNVTKTCKHTGTPNTLMFKKATCTEEGYTGDKVCSNTYCQVTIEEGTVVPKIDHKFEEGKCTNCGEIEKCEHEKTEVINAKEATCTEEGYTGDKVCSNTYCKEIIEEGTVVSKIDHKFEDGKCTNCDEIKTGWILINGKWQYNKADGTKAIGWFKESGKWYYFNNAGEMQIGWLRLGNKWYHLNQSGEMSIGWKQVNGTWYYLNNSGEMMTGWQFINGAWYYMYSSGAMATNVVIEGWKIDSNGVATPNK